MKWNWIDLILINYLRSLVFNSIFKIYVFGQECYPDNCSICEDTDPNSCIECNEGYYVNTKKICNLCTQHCFNGECSVNKCTSGCSDRYYGPDKCEEECDKQCKKCKEKGKCTLCDYNKYLPNCLGCSMNCQKDKEKAICKDNSGDCNYGCIQGYHGLKCEQKCIPNCISCIDLKNCLKCRLNHYLPNCEECSTHCLVYTGEIRCDPENGKCVNEGCENGYYGDKCKDECLPDCKTCKTNTACLSCIDNNTFLPACKKCNQNCAEKAVDGQYCNKTTGECLNGCKNTFYGSTCQGNCFNKCETCNNAKECLTCLNKINTHLPYCDPCSDGCLIEQDKTQLCDFNNGNCLYGCINGRFGDSCKQSCNQACETCKDSADICTSCKNTNTYFPYCKTCSDGCQIIPGKTQLCDKNNGKCLKGCVDEKFGEFCTETCNDKCKTCDKTADNCTSCKKVNTFIPLCNECSKYCFNKTGETQHCDKRNGKCLNGCVDGKFGDYCEKTCNKLCKTCNETADICTSCMNDNTYFPNCYSCSDGCQIIPGKTQLCDKNNGHCLNGCIDGKFGIFCTETCNDKCKTCDKTADNCTSCKEINTFIPNCKSCSINCQKNKEEVQLCDPANGKCFFGCVDHYFGDHCNLDCFPNCQTCLNEKECVTCPKRYYGKKCEGICPFNCFYSYKEKRYCDQISGDCFSCYTGFYGQKCNMTCPAGCNLTTLGCNYTSGNCRKCNTGLYDSHCDKQCPEHCKDSNCRQKNGTCYACQERFKGDKCQDCVMKYFGLKCDKNCNPGCDTTIVNCDRINGNCTDCLLGFTGIDCIINKRDNCKTFNSNTGNCEECVPTYYLNDDNYCEICSEDCKDQLCDKTHCFDCKENNKHGDFCTKTCPKNCRPISQNRYCYKETGECERCENDLWYKTDCSIKCDSDCRNNKCMMLTGKCQECNKGFYGDLCKKTCESSVPYCINCTQNEGYCTECNDTFYLDSESLLLKKECVKCYPYCLDNCKKGRCYGCKDKFYGDTCDKDCAIGCTNNCDQNTSECSPCNTGYHSFNCSEECIGCKDGCEQKDGSCPICKMNYYADNCVKTCFPCKYSCDKEEGKCIGLKCNTTNYYYNDPYENYCSNTCPSSCRNECDRITGVCNTCNENTDEWPDCELKDSSPQYTLNLRIEDNDIVELNINGAKQKYKIDYDSNSSIIIFNDDKWKCDKDVKMTGKTYNNSFTGAYCTSQLKDERFNIPIHSIKVERPKDDSLSGIDGIISLGYLSGFNEDLIKSSYITNSIISYSDGLNHSIMIGDYSSNLKENKAQLSVIQLDQNTDDPTNHDMITRAQGFTYNFKKRYNHEMIVKFSFNKETEIYLDKEIFYEFFKAIFFHVYLIGGSKNCKEYESTHKGKNSTIFQCTGLKLKDERFALFGFVFEDFTYYLTNEEFFKSTNNGHMFLIEFVSKEDQSITLGRSFMRKYPFALNQGFRKISLFNSQFKLDVSKLKIKEMPDKWPEEDPKWYGQGQAGIIIIHSIILCGIITYIVWQIYLCRNKDKTWN